MPLKKSQLYSSIWESCDKLRGGMDASQYKDYVLVLLFMKYVSDRYAGNPDALIEVPEGGSFKDMVAIKAKPDVGDRINKIIAKLAEANDLKGVIDVADFNDPDKLGKGKEMQDRLSALVDIFNNPELDFSKNRAEGDDLLGDAYEYLMRHFATESGKSKGQFYTPAEVSRIMAKVVGISSAKSKAETVYDPTCGSGSLLLKAADETKHGITIYGQENDVATRGLAKMNMILHNNPTADIRQGNTIAKPEFLQKDGTLKKFDFAVANPPFSYKAWPIGIDPDNDKYGRFEGFGIPPAKNGDYAFLLHLTKSLKSTGKGVIVMPHGVLFRGGAEAEIRKNLIKRGYIQGIIGLPPNLFYGTGIPACLVVIDKEDAETRNGIFLVDASKGFMKDGNKNRLRAQDIHKIVDVFNKQMKVSKYSRMVPVSEISDEKNDYNLNIPRYIDSQEEEDLQDIEAHLKGGIPNRDIDDLSKFWKVCPSLRQELFAPNERSGYSELNFEPTKIKSVMFGNAEFRCYSDSTLKRFREWRASVLPILCDVKVGTKPKEVIFEISERLLSAFSDDELVDKYDVYQQLMDYWAETIQDDVYLVAVEGWKVGASELKNKKGKVTGWSHELIPKEIGVKKYFAKEQEAIDTLRIEAEKIAQEMQVLDEENSGEDDVFADSRNSAGKITKTGLTKQIRQVSGKWEFGEELKTLQQYLRLTEQEAKTNGKIKDAENSLDKKLLIKLRGLTKEEIKALVVEDKWLKTIYDSVENELKRISQGLAERIKELADRYTEPLPKLSEDVEKLSKKVDNHLMDMGFRW